ncbi:UvrD family DEAD/DEAH box helicase [Erythrobacter sp.]|uniref:UvrD family DEAD/DEAH box helicase n=1 Tax=Erythrobacter sp. TaxID=1042 RepID=UPI0025D70DAE|nr:UvrD family DEAD/DEAH box helicase [Erythrobacter sp.]
MLGRIARIVCTAMGWVEIYGQTKVKRVRIGLAGAMNAAAMPVRAGNWDDDQLRVIEAGADARLIVEAGPGTGKTAVACARLAWLINEEGIEPSNAWMISFTRTAVAEIRARLHTYVGEASFAIRIATVDSHAWSIHSGHDPDARLSGSYEENIARVIELLQADQDVADELEQVEHVVIDEAQDLVGQRAELVEALVSRLPQECGVTVFADEAQAIYGFSDDRIGGGRPAAGERCEPLLGRLRQGQSGHFSTLALKQIYRTSSPGLREIFSGLRSNVLDSQNHKDGIHATTAQRIRELADEQGLKWTQMKVADFTSEDLLLFRTRGEVLMASQFCSLPHRLRLSGYGMTLPAWLAICFRDFLAPFLAEREFLDLWTDRIENRVVAQYGPLEAWGRLLRIAGRRDGAVDMRKLRQRLSQSRPPIELALPEFGLQGPIVGTIHASKGREASKVILLLPNGAEFETTEDEIEETRVLFVGATRARTSLLVGESSAFRASTAPSGRIFRTTRNGKSTMIELGRSGDITARGLAGRSEHAQADVRTAQDYLARVADVVTTYRLEADPDLDWRYRIRAGDCDGPCVGVMSRNLTYDLWDILANRNQRSSHRPPGYVNHVRGLGCATIVLGSDDPELGTLNEPWASSGFLLAPRIAAFPPFFFSGRK